MAQEIQTKLAQISFYDGCVEQVHLIRDEAHLVFRDWREQVWHLRFRGVVLFRSYEFGGDVSDIQIRNQGAVIEEAYAVIEQTGGSRAGYSGLVSVILLADSPMVTLVCQDLDITKSVAV